PSRSTLTVLWLFAAMGILGGIIVAPFALMGKEPGMVVVALLAVVVGGCCALGAIHCRRAAFRCHEFGVRQSGLTGERKLRYLDVASFTYSAVRHFHNGVYTGTAYSFHFNPTPEQKA